MLISVNPKLPMRDKAATKIFYIDQLKFTEISDYGDYLIIEKDNIEIHFFEFKELDPQENYGQTYIRTNEIDELYQSLVDKRMSIHPAGQTFLLPSQKLFLKTNLNLNQNKIENQLFNYWQLK